MFDFYSVPKISERLLELRAEIWTARLSAPPQPDNPAERGQAETNHFIEKLVRLIPSEAVALYLFAQGLIGQSRPTLLIAWSAFCLVVAGLVRYVGSKRASKSGKVQWGAITIACVSFLVWLYNIGGPFLLLPAFHDPVVASLTIAGWTTLTTIAYEPKAA